MLRLGVTGQLVDDLIGDGNRLGYQRICLGDKYIRLGDCVGKLGQSTALHLELVSGGISESYQGVLAMLANTPVCCQSLFFT